MRAVLLVLACVTTGGASAFLGGDLLHEDETITPHSGILGVPEGTHDAKVWRYLVFGEGRMPVDAARHASSENGFFLITALEEGQASSLAARGYSVIPDFEIDLHSEMGTPVLSVYESEFEYTGEGVTVAIIDTGVDFSNPDMMHALARDSDYNPVMLDADGQGIVLTNATFAANIDPNGILRNHTGSLPENVTSGVYATKQGVFLDVERGGEGTTIQVYNSFFPHNGIEPVFNGTLDDDMRIGESSRQYIESKSGLYRLGVIYQGALSGPYTGLQTIPVLLVDSETAGVYDTIIPDMSTGWEDYAGDGDYDFDFTDERPVVIGRGQEFLTYDSDGDGRDDFSAGTVGAHVVDVYGVIADEPDIDDIAGVLNATLLPPLDPGGEFFGIMTDFVGHGTSSAATIVSNGTQEYGIYNKTSKHSIRGVAPDAKIVPIKALWFGDTVYASLWAAGFDSQGNWTFSGAPRADIISNSWGVSTFPLIGQAPGLDLLSLIQSALATPNSLDRRYPGVLIVNSAGNSGHGYGTIGFPGTAPFAITVGAATDNVFVGHGSFQGEPRFGNDTDNAGQLVDFSSRGPSIVGDPKPELMGTGAYGFVPSSVNGQDDSTEGPFSLFGGTSMAAPIVSASAALVMQALGEQNQDYDPFRVKNILVSTALDMQNDPLAQGAGMVDADGAIRFVLGESGYFIVHNDASYGNIKEILDVPIEATNSTVYGLDRFKLPSKSFDQATWFGGHLLPGERSTARLTVENPSSETLELSVAAEKLSLIHRTQYDGNTVPMQQDPVLNKSGVYAPNYIRLGDIREYPDLPSYFDAPEEIPADASLMILNVNFPFGEFMNMTDPVFANDMKISSLYLYDWNDDNDTRVSSEELSLVNRAGAWGTVQEMRVSNPAEQFAGVPLVGVYPVPVRYSYWSAATENNATSIDYDLSASYYKKEKWDAVWLDRFALEIPPHSTAQVAATIVVPDHFQTGVYQGFVSFRGTNHTVNVPVTFGVKQQADADSVLVIEGKAGDDVVFGNGYFKGAFDMVNRYMAGDWRQFYFDVQDPSINTGIFDVFWEDPDTHLSLFAVDPRGRVVHSNVQPGVFGHFQGWPSSDWLGISPFSQGGGFFPTGSKSPASSAMYVPINQTGTYSILAHSGLFGGNFTTEEITVAAKFTSIPQYDPENPE